MMRQEPRAETAAARALRQGGGGTRSRSSPVPSSNASVGSQGRVYREIDYQNDRVWQEDDHTSRPAGRAERSSLGGGSAAASEGADADGGTSSEVPREQRPGSQSGEDADGAERRATDKTSNRSDEQERWLDEQVRQQQQQLNAQLAQQQLNAQLVHEQQLLAQQRQQALLDNPQVSPRLHPGNGQPMDEYDVLYAHTMAARHQYLASVQQAQAAAAAGLPPHAALMQHQQAPPSHQHGPFPPPTPMMHPHYGLVYAHPAGGWIDPRLVQQQQQQMIDERMLHQQQAYPPQQSPRRPGPPHDGLPAMPSSTDLPVYSASPPPSAEPDDDDGDAARARKAAEVLPALPISGGPSTEDGKVAGAAATAAEKSTLRRSGRKVVTFSSLEIRTYETILGDNPSCSGGPSLALGWRYDPSKFSATIDDYERHQAELYGEYETKPEDLVLHRFEREAILLNTGYTRQDLADSVRSLNRAKNRRRQTVHNLPVAFLEERAETVRRTLRRWMLKKSRTRHMYDEWRRREGRQGGGRPPPGGPHVG